MIAVEEIATAEEWFSVVNKNADGLPPCCANISALRDSILSALRQGEIDFFSAPGIVMRASWVLGDHEMTEEEYPALFKIVRAAESVYGHTHEQLAQEAQESEYRHVRKVPATEGHKLGADEAEGSGPENDVDRWKGLRVQRNIELLIEGLHEAINRAEKLKAIAAS